ncbi:DsbA family protein [Amycolatopsis nigrescens]|uniref:DsbA family protein n=1 Tax=Amycolatopsis nigrescens TaxID=381445 RepID=UPI00037F3A13|nr:thioredoxin domain-containing protein [Amycolatopsis nigrescens]
MGGAQRNARKRRQQQAASAGAKAVAQARGGGIDKKMVAVVVGIVLLAAAVIAGVLLTNASKNETQGQQIAPQSGHGLAQGVVEQREGVVVVTGKPEAKTTIDLYADFLCPACGNMQKRDSAKIEEKINAGELKVRYHMVPMLVNASDPAGYSLDSANAALAAADAGKFTAFHDSLFNAQPEEGKRGYDKAQLIELGKGVGITDPNFATSVNNGVYNQQLEDEFVKTQQDPNFKGTPTVTANGQRVEVGDPAWLDNLLATNKG